MSEDRGMSDDQIERVFGALSRIETKTDSNIAWMRDHAESTKAAFAEVGEKIEKIQIAHARQKGVIAALTGVGSVLGAGIGYAIDLFKSH